MIRFKDFLFEEDELSYARELDRKLQNSFKNNSETLLYRGTSHEIDKNGGNWEVRSIRKNRKPKDTPSAIGALVNVVGDVFYPNVPNRSESKFAASKDESDHVTRFGKNKYIVFPENAATVMSLKRDASVEYFGDLDVNLRNVIFQLSGEETKFMHQMYNTEEYKTTAKFLKYIKQFFNSNESADYSEYIKFLRKNVQELFDELDELKGGDENFGISKLEKYINGMENALEYFWDMEEGVQRGSREVIFDGNRYLIVNPNFFNSYFEWRRGEWKLKPKYMG